MKNSKIQWTDDTDNVIVVKGEDGKPDGWYCEKVSEGCQHCYAEALNATPFYGGNGLKFRRSRDGSRPPLMLRREILEKWGRATKPRKHFVNSMTDTFGKFVPDEWIFEILDAMVAAPLQTFQVLTKRAWRMHDVVWAWLRARGLKRVPPNIWLMVSAENQERLEERVPWLLRTPATVRGLSLEPLLGLIDLTEIRFVSHRSTRLGYSGDVVEIDHREPDNSTPKVHWVIIGGESGPHARPFDVAWAYNIIAQCQEARTPVFVKQLGARPYSDQVAWPLKHPKGGDPDEWPEDLRLRQFPRAEIYP